MARFFSLLSYFHVCLAMALLTIAAAAVPEKAFADTGNCYAACIEACNGDPACSLACCNCCGADPVCQMGCAFAQGGSCMTATGFRRCDKGCYYEPRKGECSITVNGSLTGCVMGDKTCALCTCKEDKMNNTDCWCQK